ncbi:hypothetical protein [Brachybacterium nesterenkovii]|uniref:hypothetical protein n=1 Tax=Brachybacterium nesterenkovii TaxID=47847 RepID=UPI00321B857A
MSIYAGPVWEVGGNHHPGVVRTRDNWTAWRAKRTGSNRYPTSRTGVSAVIGLSIIPAHCVPGSTGWEEEGWGDRARLTIDRWDPDYRRPMVANDPAGTLTIDVTAARALAAALTEWADGVTTHPEENQ